MALPCTACTCIPYSNVCCCPAQSGISVLQPSCQIIPTQTTPVNNPCFCSTCGTAGQSFWTYKFFTDCVPGTSVSAISHILIPICIDITSAQVTVEEKVDGCGAFRTLVFGEGNDWFLTTQDGNPPNNFGPSPPGFQWLKILNNGSYDKGVCVTYRVTIAGNFPPVTEAIRVKAGTNLITACLPNPCFLVPGCAAPGKLSVTKTCTTTYTNNMAAIHYQVVVTNTGGTALSNVSYTDTITYNPAQLTLGAPINLQPVPPLTAATGVGTITITAVPNIGTLAPGASFTATYDVPVTNVLTPGTLNVTNTAVASAVGTTASDTCTAAISAAQVAATKCCVPVTNGTGAEFRIVVSTAAGSPATTVSVTDRIRIPAGVTVQFPGFDGCTAIFEGDGPVPVNTNITNATIILTCSGLAVPGNGGSTTISIPFTLVSTTAFTGTVRIENAVQQVAGVNTDQVFLQPQIVSPAAIVVGANAACDNNLCPGTGTGFGRLF